MRMTSLVSGVTALVLPAGCSNATAPVEFTIHVDSISGPTAISRGVAFEARLWGTLGSTGCSSFKELRTTRVPSQLDVTVIGQRIDGVPCKQAFVPLDGVVLRIEPVIPPDFRIVVHQEDGSVLLRAMYSE